jgi:hypothetical protein
MGQLTEQFGPSVYLDTNIRGQRWVTRRHLGETGSINLDYYLYEAPDRIGESPSGFQRSN